MSTLDVGERSREDDIMVNNECGDMAAKLTTS